jgi:hypothetical protein
MIPDVMADLSIYLPITLAVVLVVFMFGNCHFGLRSGAKK